MTRTTMKKTVSTLPPSRHFRREKSISFLDWVRSRPHLQEAERGSIAAAIKEGDAKGNKTTKSKTKTKSKSKSKNKRLTKNKNKRIRICKIGIVTKTKSKTKSKNLNCKNRTEKTKNWKQSKNKNQSKNTATDTSDIITAVITVNTAITDKMGVLKCSLTNNHNKSNRATLSMYHLWGALSLQTRLPICYRARRATSN